MKRIALVVLLGCSATASARPHLLEAGQFLLTANSPEASSELEGMSHEELRREQQRLKDGLPSLAGSLVPTIIGGSLLLGGGLMIGWGAVSLMDANRSGGSYFSGLLEGLVIVLGIIVAIPGVVLLIVGLVKLAVRGAKMASHTEKMDEIQRRLDLPPPPERVPPPPPPLEPGVMRAPTIQFQLARF